MKQFRRMSLVEALVNVAVGYGLAVLTQIAVFPLFGLHASLSENLAIGAIFTEAVAPVPGAQGRLLRSLRFPC